MSHLAPELLNHGHPDVAFDLLAADGAPSYYNMARYGLTLWENWYNADGCDTPAGCDKPVKTVEGTGAGVGSLNHIMYGGSVGAAVFGIGGIQPLPTPPQVPQPASTTAVPSEPLSLLSRSEAHPRSPGARAHAAADSDRHSVAPIPWLPDAPRGAAVWRSRAGIISAAWAAAVGSTGEPGWRVWVNVTVPTGSDGADIQVMLPRLAEPGSTCAWECGDTGAPGFGAAPPAGTYSLRWVAFGAAGGHTQVRAVVPLPSTAATPPPRRTLVDDCRPVWRAGAPTKVAVPGLEHESIAWAPAQPGHSMFPALTLAATSGVFAVYAEAC